MSLVVSLLIAVLAGVAAQAAAAVLTHYFTSKRDQANAVLTHDYTSKRDQENRRSDLRIEYLLDAYRSISDAIGRDLTPGSTDSRSVEKAISDMQLLGTREQAGLAADVAQTMSKDGIDPGNLLKSLRDELRGELGLVALSDKPVHMRVKEPA